MDYDREYVLQLDDWLDRPPENVMEELRGSGMGGMMGGGMEDSGDVDYPLYLINGRAPEDPETLKVRRGERIRLRLANPSADTIFRFAIGGHRLIVTHADGQPVEHVTVDSLRIGMGERYDVLVEANEPGVWQIAAAPEGKSGIARAVIRYEESGESSPPPPDSMPKELGGKVLKYADLRNKREEYFPSDRLLDGPDRVHDLTLSGGMGEYVWSIDGQVYPDAETLQVREGKWVRVTMQNRIMMPHPMRLHGHFFHIQNGTGRGPIKDTAIVEPHMGRLTFNFAADNPGDWFFHCHNAYHVEAGMARLVSYKD